MLNAANKECSKVESLTDFPQVTLTVHRYTQAGLGTLHSAGEEFSELLYALGHKLAKKCLCVYARQILVFILACSYLGTITKAWPQVAQIPWKYIPVI